MTCGVDVFFGASYFLASDLCCLKRFHRRRKTSLFFCSHSSSFVIRFRAFREWLAPTRNFSLQGNNCMLYFQHDNFHILYSLRLLSSHPLVISCHQVSAFPSKIARLYHLWILDTKKRIDGFISHWTVSFKSTTIVNKKVRKKKKIGCLPSRRKNASLRNLQIWGMRTLAACLSIRCHIGQLSKKLQRLDVDYRPA
jgi:hypothetical protein